MNMAEPHFDRSTFSKNRERLLQHQVGQQCFFAVVRQVDERHPLSDEHFTVDGTLTETAAGLMSLRRKDGPPPLGCFGTPRTFSQISTNEYSAVHQSPRTYVRIGPYHSPSRLAVASAVASLTL